jgi:hypothetical protein
MRIKMKKKRWSMHRDYFSKWFDQKQYLTLYTVDQRVLTFMARRSSCNNFIIFLLPLKRYVGFIKMQINSQLFNCIEFDLFIFQFYLLIFDFFIKFNIYFFIPIYFAFYFLKLKENEKNFHSIIISSWYSGSSYQYF